MQVRIARSGNLLVEVARRRVAVVRPDAGGVVVFLEGSCSLQAIEHATRDWVDQPAKPLDVAEGIWQAV